MMSVPKLKGVASGPYNQNLQYLNEHFNQKGKYFPLSRVKALSSNKISKENVTFKIIIVWKPYLKFTFWSKNFPCHF